jgi:hypothetical protein
MRKGFWVVPKYRSIANDLWKASNPYTMTCSIEDMQCTKRPIQQLHRCEIACKHHAVTLTLDIVPCVSDCDVDMPESIVQGECGEVRDSVRNMLVWLAPLLVAHVHPVGGTPKGVISLSLSKDSCLWPYSHYCRPCARDIRCTSTQDQPFDVPGHKKSHLTFGTGQFRELCKFYFEVLALTLLRCHMPLIFA